MAAAVRRIVIGCLVARLGVAHADDVSLAGAHARHSTTLYLATAWSPGPTVPIRIGAEAALRVQRRIALELRIGAGGAGSVLGISSQLAWHGGLSAGVAVPIGSRVVLAPMVAYDYYGLRNADGRLFAVHEATVELPIAIVLARGAVLEPFVQAGLSRYSGSTDWTIVVGPRIGLVL